MVIRGVPDVPLLMHSARLSDPLDPATKALAKLTGERRKTDELHMAIAKAEFVGSMYYDPELGPYIPGQNIHQSLINAGKKTRQGSTVEGAVLIEQPVNPLVYEGPDDIEKLWEQGFYQRDSVRVQTSRTMRTRPAFKNWALSTT